MYFEVPNRGEGPRLFLQLNHIWRWHIGDENLGYWRRHRYVMRPIYWSVSDDPLIRYLRLLSMVLCRLIITRPVIKDDAYTAQQATNVEYHIWTHKGHPRTRPHGRALGCLLWVYKRKLVILYIMRPHALINTTRSFAAGHKEDHDTWFVISSWCFGLKILTWLVSQWVSGKLHPRCH